MEISFLIVTRNRPEDLRLTLNKLQDLIDTSVHEVQVFIDGCEKTSDLIPDFEWVKWSRSQSNIGASPARHQLYQKALGKYLVGLDDDAHPISVHFIAAVKEKFETNPNLGIIAFQEVRGLYDSDEDALRMAQSGNPFPVKEFIGCGFAVRKAVYDQTGGFPLWMDIYGEEVALSLEVLDLGYQLVYEYGIIVNHRVDVQKRKLQNRNYFRFEKQLVNVLAYYTVYHKKPLYGILRTLFHNFKKYAVRDFKYFWKYLKAVASYLLTVPQLMKYRKPVSASTIALSRKLRAPFYH